MNCHTREVYQDNCPHGHCLKSSIVHYQLQIEVSNDEANDEANDDDELVWLVAAADGGVVLLLIVGVHHGVLADHDVIQKFRIQS